MARRQSSAQPPKRLARCAGSGRAGERHAEPASWCDVGSGSDGVRWVVRFAPAAESRTRWRRASTTRGSNWAPAQRRISAAASAIGIAVAVAARGRHRVPRVAAAHDPWLRAGSLAAEAIGVAAPVPALVVRAHDQAYVAHEAADAVEHSLPLDRVGLDDGPLGRIELAGLVDDLLGDGDLADVVQERAELQVAALGRVEASALPTSIASATTPCECSPV